MTAPLLVVAIGNASRGDDALGPQIAARLRDEGLFDDAQQAELLEAYQLQVEDALALLQRRAVLFIDAARAGAGCGVALSRVEPAAGPTAFTHALAPQALLALVPRVSAAPPPPAWLLAIEGEAFELGAPLSAAAAVRLQQAVALARQWLRRADAGSRAAHRTAPRRAFRTASSPSADRASGNAPRRWG